VKQHYLTVSYCDTTSTAKATSIIPPSITLDTKYYISYYYYYYYYYYYCYYY